MTVSNEQATNLAAKYNANGQKTGQTANYFNWWLALDDDSEGLQKGPLLGFEEVLAAARDEKTLHILGEASGTGREINANLPVKCESNMTIKAVLEDGVTEVVLYRNAQVDPSAEVIRNYFFIADDDECLTFSELEKRHGQNREEQTINVHGQIATDKEVTVTVTHAIDYADRNDGTLLAVGAGQRYILRQPAEKADVQAWETSQRRRDS